jgi:uncharacterized membrane protein YhaH (DUF805 family)
LCASKSGDQIGVRFPVGEGELVKTFTIVALVLSSLLVLIWPLIMFALAFMNDNPKGSETLIATFNLLVLYYPLGWIVAMISLLVRRLRKSPKKWWESPTPYLFLTPFAQLAIAAIVLTFNSMVLAKS